MSLLVGFSTTTDGSTDGSTELVYYYSWMSPMVHLSQSYGASPGEDPHIHQDVRQVHQDQEPGQGEDKDSHQDDGVYLKNLRPIQLRSNQMDKKSGGRVMKSTIWEGALMDTLSPGFSDSPSPARK